MDFLKRRVPLILVFVMGVMFIVQYFVPHEWSQDALTWVSKWISVIGGVSLLLGLASIIHFHYTKVRRKTGGWGYSIVMFFGLALATLAGFLPAILAQYIPPVPPLLKPTFLGITLISGTDKGGPLDWLFNSMINPMSATMFAIIGFFIASAAFRAFRARSLEATLLLVAAVIIMLGQTPIGAKIWSGVPDVMTWILTTPNTAAKRAILFGIALGSIAFSLRIILGIERGYLGGKD